MSGLACILDRRGGEIPGRRIERLGDSLTMYGTSSSVLCTGPFGVVVRHSKSDRSVQDHGPIRDQRSGVVVAVAGRFGHVVESTSPSPRSIGDPEEVGCARWALERWLSDGRNWLGEIAGSFTLLVADPCSGWVSIYRDHLGDVKVYYRLSDRLLIAATEAGAVLDGASVPAEPDEHSAARFLGFRFGHNERSFFGGISELAPAHRLRVDDTGSNTERFWRMRYERDDSSAEECQARLVDHLSRSMRFHEGGIPPEEIGLSLSGGLDSTAIAAVATRGIKAYSWFLENPPDSEERENTGAVSQRLNLPVRWINGDGSGPLSDGFYSRFVHRSSPYVNPFAALKQRLYAAARNDGCRRMVVGDAGDVLFGAGDLWLRDGLVRRHSWAFLSLAGEIVRAARRDTGSRTALRRLVPIRRSGRFHFLRRRPDWMTPEGGSLLRPEELSPILPDGPAGSRYDLSVGARNIELESEERRLFSQCGIERANPFWHWPLLEAVLRMPAYRLARSGREKVLTREAFKGMLPDRVLESGRVGLLGDFFLRGIEARRDQIFETVFRRPQSDWQRYVRREWLEPHLSATDAICFGHTILWRVISYELWFRRVWGDDPARLA